VTPGEGVRRPIQPMLNVRLRGRPRRARMSRPARSAPVGGGNAFIVSDWSSQDFMDTVKRRAVPAGRCLNVEAIEPVGYKTGIRIHQGAAIDHDWQLFGNQPQTASGRFWPGTILNDLSQSR
jgi:hypothetical protein